MKEETKPFTKEEIVKTLIKEGIDYVEIPQLHSPMYPHRIKISSLDSLVEELSNEVMSFSGDQIKDFIVVGMEEKQKKGILFFEVLILPKFCTERQWR